MNNALVTVITPTTGKDSLFKLIKSLGNQNIPYVHLLLWDNKREGRFRRSKDPKDLERFSNNTYITNSIVIRGGIIQGPAAGSALRAVGLMIANTPYVTFADDDVWLEDNHLSSLVATIEKEQVEWAYCYRKMWSPDGSYLGKDTFESVGDLNTKKVPYEMVDNSSMMFSRRFGSSAACLYRETKDYNDDRLMYGFLKKYAGKVAKTNQFTVNQTCPSRLVDFFQTNCEED